MNTRKNHWLEYSVSLFLIFFWLAFLLKELFTGRLVLGFNPGGLLGAYLLWVILVACIYSSPGEGMLHKAVIVLGSPLLLPYFILSLAAYHYFLQEWSLRRHLRRAGRLIPPAERAALSSRGGTILLDHAAFNHNRTRLWWTPDDVLALAPEAPPASYLGGIFAENPLKNYIWPTFDRWVWERYVNPDSGAAALISSSLKWRTRDSLARYFPGCKVVVTYSGGQQLARMFSDLAEPQEPGA